MDILVTVKHQKLTVTSNYKPIIGGSQKFVRFAFNLDKNWSELVVFAQFTQDGIAYNTYLDDDKCCYLPAEIKEGSCTLMIYGTGEETIGTSNYVTLDIDKNILVANAQSTEITQSLYQQLVNIVNNYTLSTDRLQAQIDLKADLASLNTEINRATNVETNLQNQINTKADASTVEELDTRIDEIENGSAIAAAIDSSVQAEIQRLIESGALANITIEDHSITRDKVDSDFEATLAKADSAMQASVYDPLGYGERAVPIDPYSFAQAQDTATKNAIKNTENYEVNDSAVTNTPSVYTGLNSALSGVLNRAELYAGALLSNYSPINIVITDTLPDTGAERTFYLVPKESGTGYDKYWYITDETGTPKWDNFGSSSTLVVDELPLVGDPDTDYILSNNGSYQYFKYIGNTWCLIAGSNYTIISLPSGISNTDVRFAEGSPEDGVSYGKTYYVDTLTMSIYTAITEEHDDAVDYSYSDPTQLVQNASEDKDYYILDDNNTWGHYRYFTNVFKQIGSSAYSRSEVDALIADLVASVNTKMNAQDSAIAAVDGKVSALGNMVSDVTAGSTGIVVHYKDGTTSPVATKDATTVVEDVVRSEDGITINYTDGTSDNIEISGGGGSGGDTSGSASITRVTPSSTQCVYGRSCPIEYTFTALDSSGDMVGDGDATWYVGGVRKATSTARQGDGITNTFDIGEYLSVGTNTVRLSISVDTGGDTPKVVTKTWSVNAINMYLTWDYEDITVNEGTTFTLRMTPFGDLSKVLHIVFDNDEENEYTMTVTRSGVQQAITFDALEHGSHMVQAYLTASVNGENITSDSIYHDMIFVESGKTDPVISCSLSQYTMTQYNTLQIPIVVYNPSALTSTVVLAVDGNTVATWTNVDRTLRYWNYTPNDYGEKVLTITSGTTVKTLNITVEELDIDNDEVGGYSFRLKASDLTGNTALQSWESNGVTASFSNNFDWNNGGLKTETDESGNIRQYICVKAGTTMTINHKLFGDDPTLYGKTVKVIFKIENARNYDATVASCYADNIGLRLNAHEAIFSSTGTSVSVPYGEDEYIELEFDVYPAPTENNGSFRYIMAWIDGVITTCRVYGQSDNFTQSNQNLQDIVIGSNDCDVYIYMVKAYPNYMTRENHIVNFIADAPNAQEMVKRYDRNDILDISGEISYEKLAQQNPDCRVWLYDIPYMTVGKKDKVKNCSFNQFWKNGDQYYELSGTGTMTVQGTSSVDYLLGAANTDINFTSLSDGNGVNLMANGVVDEDNYGKNYFVGNTETGEVTVFDVDSNTELTPDCIPVERDENRNVTKYIKALGYKINDDSAPITYSNTKVNFASCEQVNNMCNAIWYQRFQPYQSLTPRDCMEFAMGVQFIKDSGTVPDNDHFVLFGDNKYHMYSIANMGNSKKNVHVFHDLSNPNECCVEVGNNLNDLCRMVTDDLSASIWYGGKDKSFEMRYPDTDTPSQTLIDGWQRLVSWMCANNPNAATGEQLPTPETYGNYTFRGHDRGGTQVLKGTRVTQYAGTYTHDTFNRRMAKMLSECEDYLVMDSVIYHFVYLERHTMCDNVAKNSFWSSSDLLHWDLSKAYDMDTSDGNNNEGKMVFDYGNEANDVIGSKTVFNANDAVWFVFASNLFEACQTMFTNRETAGAWSATAYHNFLLEQQQKVPERVWNQCYWYDYLRTYEREINDSWMEFLDGGQKTHQRWHYEYFEEIYDSSKYRGTSCTVQNVNFRGYYPERWEGLTDEQWNAISPQPQIHLKMYNKCYINVSIDGTIYRQKAEKGLPYTIDFSEQAKLNDTVINIYSAQMIQEIGDISRLYPGTPNFSNATRLRSLTVGNSTDGYENSNLTGVTLGNNTMLEYLYVQNLAHINSGLDLSKCQSLIYLDASGSSFTGYEFAVGGLLTEAYIEAPTALSFRNLYYLEDENLHVTDYSNLDTLRIENCSGIDALAIIGEATNLARLRVLDVDWTLPETTILNKLLLIAGLNENGNNVPVSVLTGRVYISGSIRNKELEDYANAWANLSVSYDPNNLIAQHKITYVNADGTTLYTTYVDQGNLPPEPISAGYIDTPTMASTAQYNYTFSGWSGITEQVYAPRTVTAQYTETVRTYTVNFFSRPGVIHERFTEQAYGSEVVPTSSPTWDEGQTYRLFEGWDKSTGYITGDMDVYAIWNATAYLPALGTPLNEMTPAEIYGIANLGQQEAYGIEDGDYIDIKLGDDYDFTNIEHIEIGKDLLLTNIQRDTFVSGGYYFDGSHAFTTDIKLFDEDKSFTMVLDFQMDTTVGGAQTLVSTHEAGVAEGFRIYANGNNIYLQWGDTTQIIGYKNYRTILVIRRNANDPNRLHIYTADINNTQTFFSDEVTRVPMLRSNATHTEEPITFGGMHFSDGFREYGKGTIHWCKIWYGDLGNAVCNMMATFPREVIRMEYWGAGCYYYAGLSQTCKMSFIANSAIGGVEGRGLRMNDTNTNVGGWHDSDMRAWLNDRFYKALPMVWKSAIKAVEIKATAGNQSTAIVTDYDKIYLASQQELSSSVLGNGYNQEVGNKYPISWLISNVERAKPRGRNRKYGTNKTIYTCDSDPAALYQSDMAEGTIWVNTNNSSRLYMFITKDEIDQYGLTPQYTADSKYALGGWFEYKYWWLRSPYIASSTGFYGVNNIGNLSTSSASYTYSVVPCFSI